MTRTETIQLKPCPFCGKTDKHEDNCYIIMLATFYKEKGYFSVSETGLRNAWNTRAEITCNEFECENAGSMCSWCVRNYCFDNFKPKVVDE